MITGAVNADLEAVIRFSVRGPNGQHMDIEAIVDTGFNGFLTLPPALVATLRLPRRGRGRATLADGSEQIIDIHRATVIWDGEALQIEADAVGDAPLVGMSLLHGHYLSIRVVDGGMVATRKTVAASRPRPFGTPHFVSICHPR